MIGVMCVMLSRYVMIVVSDFCVLMVGGDRSNMKKEK